MLEEVYNDKDETLKENQTKALMLLFDPEDVISEFSKKEILKQFDIFMIEDVKLFLKQLINKLDLKGKTFINWLKRYVDEDQENMINVEKL